jgi:hypothetical protein
MIDTRTLRAQNRLHYGTEPFRKVSKRNYTKPISSTFDALEPARRAHNFFEKLT